MDTLLLFQTLAGPVEVDASAIVGHITIVPVGAGGGHVDTARVNIPSSLTLYFATNEEASETVERIHAARVAHRSAQADGLAGSMDQSKFAGELARELIAQVMPVSSASSRWEAIKSACVWALSEAAKAGAREYAERMRVTTVDRIECPVVPVFATKEE